jgi:hypothetical protein
MSNIPLSTGLIEKANPPYIDAAKIGRSGYITTILIKDRQRFLTNFRWMRLGACQLFTSGRDGTMRFGAQYRESENSEANLDWIFQFDVCGVEVRGISEGVTRITAWIEGDGLAVFNVPAKFPSKQRVRLPPHNVKLYEIMRGRRIEIVIRRSDDADDSE